MESAKIIIVQSEQMCPHCNGKFMTEIRMTRPVVYWSLKYDDLKKVKEKIMKEVLKIEFKNLEHRKQTMAYLENPETMIGPEEADILIEQIKADNKVEEPKKEDK